MAQIILRLDAGKAFFVQKELFSKGGVLHKDIVDRMTSPKSQAADLVFNAIKGTPQLTRETNQVLSQFTAIANRGLSGLFGTTQLLLKDPSRLPKVGVGGAGGPKRITVTGQGRSFNTSPWPGLSESYSQAIKAMRRKGSRTDAPKRFWYERGDRTTAHKPPGRPLHEMVSVFTVGIGGSIFSTPLKHTITKTGSSTGFSFDASTTKWTKRRGHTATRGGKVIRVGGFTGQMLFPKTIPVLAGDSLEPYLTTLLFDSVAMEQERRIELPSLGIDKEAGPDLLQLLLMNESTRPFISKLFSRGTPLLIQRLRTLALTFK